MNEEETSNEEVIVPYYKLFTFADSTDCMLMLIGTITAIGSGIAMPLQTLIFGDLIDTFGENKDNKLIVHQVSKVYSFEHQFLNLIYSINTSQPAPWIQPATFWLCGTPLNDQDVHLQTLTSFQVIHIYKFFSPKN